MPELEILNIPKASNALIAAFNAATESGFNIPEASVKKHVAAYYEKSFLLARADTETQTILEQHRAKNPPNSPMTISCISFMSPQYSREFLLAQLKARGLPVALIQGIALKTLKKLLDDGFILGTAQDETTRNKILALLNADKRVILSLHTGEPVHE